MQDICHPVPGTDVEIRWTGDSAAEVVIAVRCDNPRQDDAVALARAWTALAEAISMHKAVACNAQDPHPPGSGGWWEG